MPNDEKIRTAADVMIMLGLASDSASVVSNGKVKKMPGGYSVEATVYISDAQVEHFGRGYDDRKKDPDTDPANAIPL